MNTFANKSNEFVTTEASHLDNDDALNEFAAKMPGSVSTDDTTQTYAAKTETVPSQDEPKTANAEVNGDHNSLFKTANATSLTPASGTSLFDSVTSYAGARLAHGVQKRFAPVKKPGTLLMRIKKSGVYKRSAQSSNTHAYPYGIAGMSHDGERITIHASDEVYAAAQENLNEGNHFMVHMEPTTDCRAQYRDAMMYMDYYIRVKNPEHIAYANGCDAEPNAHFPEIPLAKGQLLTFPEIANLKDGEYVSTLGNIQDDGELQTRTVRASDANPHGESVYTYVVTILGPLSKSKFMRVTFWGQAGIDAHTQVAQIRQSGYTGPIVLLFVNGKKRCNKTNATATTPGITEANVNEYTPFYFITNNIEERLGDLASYPDCLEHEPLADTFVPGEAKKLFPRWDVVHYKSHTVIAQTPTPGEQKKLANKTITNTKVNDNGLSVPLTGEAAAPTSATKRKTPLPSAFASFASMMDGGSRDAVANEVVKTPPRPSHDASLNTPIGTPSTASQQRTPASSPLGASSMPVVHDDNIPNVTDVSKQAAKKIRDDQMFNFFEAFKDHVANTDSKFENIVAELKRVKENKSDLTLSPHRASPPPWEQELDNVQLPTEYTAPQELKDTVTFALGEKTPSGKTHVLTAQVKQEPGVSFDEQDQQQVEKSIQNGSFDSLPMPVIREYAKKQLEHGADVDTRGNDAIVRKNVHDYLMGYLYMGSKSEKPPAPKATKRPKRASRQTKK